MPTYKNITVSLRSSAHETAPLLEFPPPPHLPVPIEDPANSTAAVYVLSSPGLAFWIAYHVKPPVPPETQYFLFKLFMDGRHVVSWSVGEEDGWRGKTMFGLFENEEWKGGVEKRAFAFAAGREEGEVDVRTDHESRFLEVQVLRASARKRVQRQTPELMETEVGKEGAGGIDLVNAGCLKKENPKRFYAFALIDSLKKPYAKFRYYYRTEEQLETLGVIVRAPLSDDDSEEGPVMDSGNGFDDLDLSFLSETSAEGPSDVAEPHENSVPEESPPSVALEPHATLVPESPPSVVQERLSLAISSGYGDPVPEATSYPTPNEDAAVFHGQFGQYTAPEPPRTPSPCTVSPLKWTPAKASLWSPPKSAKIAMRNSGVVPMTVPDSPTRGSVAEAAAVGALSEQDWLKRTPSPDRSIFREVDSPAPGASRRGRKSPTGRLKQALKRALGRGDA